MRRQAAAWSVAVFSVLFAACAQTGPGGGNGSGSGADGGNGGDGGIRRSADGGCLTRTCAEANATCGPVGDGCGGTVDCGSCSSGQTCGGGGTPSQCGSGGTCIRQTCLRAQANCGTVADGCGGTIDCGTCIAPSVCGGDSPNVCSGTEVASCDNLCKAQVSCPSGTTTTISGTVHAPTDTSLFGPADPLYGALVYIPNGTVAPFTPGVACDQCGTPASGDPIVEATTGPDGTYTLSNVPVGNNVPLVVQIGHWRRQTTVNVAPCTNNAVPDDDDRMPRTSAEGDIPRIAIATGDSDPFECMMRKLGIADSEFTLPGGGGRVDFYTGNGAELGTLSCLTNSDCTAPLTCDYNNVCSVSQTTLTSDLSKMEQYDMIILACWGEEDKEPAADLSNMVAYSNAGGRIFATHYSYVWLYQNSPFDTTATWDKCTMGGAAAPNQFGSDTCGSANQQTATVDQTFERGMAFADWLKITGASTTLGQIEIQQTRHNFDAVAPALSERWLYSGSQPLHYTFNTPVGAAAGAQCGRVLFSDFHVNLGSSSLATNFPAECNNSPMVPQERALEFMLFDLSSCVAPPGK